MTDQEVKLPEAEELLKVGEPEDEVVTPEPSPEEDRAKASGWVPKDVIRLVQAFKHSHGIKVEWR